MGDCLRPDTFYSGAVGCGGGGPKPQNALKQNAAAPQGPSCLAPPPPQEGDTGGLGGDMGELSSPQPPQPRPLREAARKSLKVWGGERVARPPRAPEGLSRDRGGLSRSPLWPSPGSGESKGLGLVFLRGQSWCPLWGRSRCSPGFGHDVPFPPWVPWGPGVDPNVSLSRSPSPPRPPARLPRPTAVALATPNVTSAARSHNFRVWRRSRLFPPQPHPHGGCRCRRRPSPSDLGPRT